MTYGANNYIFLRGNAHIYDEDLLDAICQEKQIDVKNVAYNYDVSSDFTWDYKELVQIKQRQRIKNRFYRPVGKVIKANASAV